MLFMCHSSQQVFSLLTFVGQNFGILVAIKPMLPFLSYILPTDKALALSNLLAVCFIVQVSLEKKNDQIVIFRIHYAALFEDNKFNSIVPNLAKTH